MHRKFRRGLALLLVLVIFISLFQTTEASAKKTGKSVPVLKEDSVTLYLKGEYATQYAIQIENLPSKAKVTYTTSDAKVAAVNEKGIVTPVKKGAARITASVVKGKKKYSMNLAVNVRKASLSFSTQKAKSATAEKPVQLEVGQTLKTGVRLSGSATSVYSASNNHSYNMKAVVYSAKTGRKLATAKNASGNKYLGISENGRITAKKKGEYYVEFTSVPKGCSKRLYVSVRRAENKKPQTEVTEQETSPTPLPVEAEKKDSKEKTAAYVNSGTSQGTQTHVSVEQTPSEAQKAIETPVFVTVNVESEKVNDFTFEIRDYKSGCIDSFINAADETCVEYEIEGNTVRPLLEKGQTYVLTLKAESGACIVANGEVQSETVTTLNIITGKEEVLNLSLDNTVKYLSANEVSDIKGQLFDGLYKTGLDNDNPEISQNENRGSFTYSGNDIEIKEGDVIAVYQGMKPDERDLDTVDTEADGSIAYITITSVNGSTYNFEKAEAENVLRYSEVLPVNIDADTDGDSTDHSIRVLPDTFDYSDAYYAELGLDGTTTADEGDYILFYSGSLGSGVAVAYAKITEVSYDGEYITVDYVTVSEEEVSASMDMYSRRNGEIELTDEEMEQIAKDIKEQAEESGFLTEAGDYLVALAIETDGFRELSEDLDMDLESYDIHLADAQPDGNGENMLLMGSDTEVSIKNINVNAKVLSDKNKMVHFNRKGLRVELGMDLTLQFISREEKQAMATEKGGGHLELELHASFIEEVYFDIDIDGKAVWKKKWIFPYIADYQVTSSLECGTFTEIGITSTVKTVMNKKSPSSSNGGTMLWGKLTTVAPESAVRDIGDEIRELMKKKDFALMEADGADPNAGVLGQKYADFIKNANNSWIPVVKQRIFKVEGSFDPFHIFAYGLYADFVINVNMYVTVGFTLQTGEANRYIFNLRLKAKSANTNTVNLSKTPFEYEMYVFGTAGIKAGVQFEIAVGLGKLDWDSLSIIAECGAYAQLWGYFYASYYDGMRDGGYVKENYARGALLLEIGIYLSVKFKAQFLNKTQLTALKPIYEKEWPLLSVGEQNDVIGFAKKDFSDGDVKNLIELVGDKEMEFSNTIFDMRYLDLKTGKLDIKNYDDDTESNFEITLSNRKFSYDPKTNKLKVNVSGRSSDREECVMTIIWKSSGLTFAGEEIKKTFRIVWTDPANARYITFDTKGGSYVKSCTGVSGSVIKAPEAPVRAGYVFEGWYADADYENEFTLPEVMPNYENRGITVYAKWSTAKDTPYTVNYYIEGLNGRYGLAEAEVRKGETNTRPSAEALKKDFEGAEYYTAVIDSIRPDGQAVMNIYYRLKSCTVTFTYGEFADEERQDICYTVKYGTPCCAPSLVLIGYDFNGFKELPTDENGYFTVNQSVTYDALWKPSENTVYGVEHYLYDPETGLYELIDASAEAGSTGSAIDIDAFRLADSIYVFEKMEVINGDDTAPVISAKGDTVVKLFYDRKTYSLTFMSGTSVVGEPLSKKWGENIGRPDGPSRRGYVFTGWYSDSSCDDNLLFEFDGAIMPAADLTFYAGWIPGDNTYSVNYYGQNANDNGYTLIESAEDLEGKTDSIATAEYKSFEHYVMDENAADTVNGVAVSPEGDTVLRLYYNRETVDITFEPAGGSLNCNSVQTFRYGQNFNVNAPSRDNYAFTGWYLADGERYDASRVYENTDFTLKAGWDAENINYKVEHYVMDTNGEYPSTADYTDTLNAKEDSEQSLMGLIKSGIEVEDGIVCRKAIRGESEDYIALDGGDKPVKVNSGLTIKLYYEREKHEIEWKLGSRRAVNGEAYSKGQVYYDAEIVEPVPEAHEGYIYGFTPSVALRMPAADVEYTLVDVPVSYSISFRKNAPLSENEVNTMSDMQNLVYDRTYVLLENAFTRTGYEFAGWSLTQKASYEAGEYYSDGAEIANLTAVQNGNVVLYAVWKPVKYQIILTGDIQLEENLAVVCQYSESAPEVREYTFGESLVLPEPFCKGFDFEGWYADSDYSGNRITAISKTDIGDRHLWAKWKLHEYTVTWDANGGCFEEPESEKVSCLTTPITIDNTPSAPKTAPVMAADAEYSYVFSGWYTSKNGGMKLEECESLDITRNLKFYAHWTAVKNRYYVKWVLSADDALSVAYAAPLAMILTGFLLRYDDSGDFRRVNSDCWSQELCDQYLEDYDKMDEVMDETEDMDTKYQLMKDFFIKYYPTGYDYDHFIDLFISGNYADATEEEAEELINRLVAPVEYGTKINVPFACIDDIDRVEKAGWYDIEDCELIETEGIDSSGEKILQKRYVLNNPNAIPLGMGQTVERDVTYVFVYRYKYNTIIWDPNTDASASVVFPEEYTCKDNTPEIFGTKIIAPELTRTPDVDKEYTFEGWYTRDVAGEGERFTQGTLEQDVTYYAHWKESERKYTITFDPMDGSDEKVCQLAYGRKLAQISPELYKSVADDAIGVFRGYVLCDSISGRPVTDENGSYQYFEQMNRDEIKVEGDLLFKADWTYNACIFGEEICSLADPDKNYVPEDMHGTATFDVKLWKLVLTDCKDEWYYSYFYKPKKMTGFEGLIVSECVPKKKKVFQIEVKGTNKINFTDDIFCANIAAIALGAGISLNITGTGSLDILSYYAGSPDKDSCNVYGIYLDSGGYMQAGCSVSISSGVSYRMILNPENLDSAVLSDKSTYDYGIYADNIQLLYDASLYIWASPDNGGTALKANYVIFDTGYMAVFGFHAFSNISGFSAFDDSKQGKESDAESVRDAHYFIYNTEGRIQQEKIEMSKKVIKAFLNRK